MTTRLLLALLGASGCSDYDLGAERAPRSDTGWGGDAGGDTADTGPNDTDTDLDEVPPDGWVLHARLAAVGGVPVADGADVRVAFVNGDAGEVACEVPLDPAGVVAGTSPEDVVALWWELPALAEAEACGPLPATLGVGVGELHASARARLGTVGLDTVADSLYGAYVRADDGPVYVLGYAGTDGDLAGDDVATTPPPDGTYTLAPLYVLPLAR